MIRGIHHVSMKCLSGDEFARAKAFYLETLGLPVRREWPQGIMIDAGNALIEIFCTGEGVKEKGALRHIALAVDDVDAYTEKARRAGCAVLRESGGLLIPSDPPLRARMAFCLGPLGEQIEFFCEEQAVEGEQP